MTRMQQTLQIVPGGYHFFSFREEQVEHEFVRVGGTDSSPSL